MGTPTPMPTPEDVRLAQTYVKMGAVLDVRTMALQIAAEREAAEQWEQWLCKLLECGAPPPGKRQARHRIAHGLYLLLRRNRDGTISRFWVARIATKKRRREHGLGPASGPKAVSFDDATDKLKPLLDEAKTTHGWRREFSAGTRAWKAWRTRRERYGPRGTRPWSERQRG
jgi:hypothetical protein